MVETSARRASSPHRGSPPPSPKQRGQSDTTPPASRRRSSRAREVLGRTGQALGRTLRIQAQRGRSRLKRARLKIAEADVPASVLLLAVAVLLPLFTFVAAFRISSRVSEGAIFRQKGYFLSAAIDIQPASNFGALGITTSLTAFVFVAFVRHKIVGLALGDRRLGLHRFSLAMAFVGSFGGNGVAAYQHHASRAMHNTFAAIFVLGALAHFSCEAAIVRPAQSQTLERAAAAPHRAQLLRLLLTRQEWLEQMGSRTSRAFRLGLCVVATCGTATFISHILVEEMRKTPLGIGKFAAAMAEITTVSAVACGTCD